jgi:hypothetical protein
MLLLQYTINNNAYLKCKQRELTTVANCTVQQLLQYAGYAHLFRKYDLFTQYFASLCQVIKMLLPSTRAADFMIVLLLACSLAN